MTKRVQEAHAKWPSFDDMPVSTAEGNVAYEITDDPEDEQVYIAALYELAQKATPVGRAEKADIIYGKPGQ
jgi:hypothetical protein